MLVLEEQVAGGGGFTHEVGEHAVLHIEVVIDFRAAVVGVGREGVPDAAFDEFCVANNAVAMAIPEKSQRQSMAQPADLQDAGKALLPAWGSKWEDMGTSRVNRLTCNRQTRRATSCLSRLAGYFQENSPVSFFLTLFGPRTEHDPRHKDGAETGLGVVV